MFCRIYDIIILLINLLELDKNLKKLLMILNIIIACLKEYLLFKTFHLLKLNSTLTTCAHDTYILDFCIICFMITRENKQRSFKENVSYIEITNHILWFLKVICL